MWKILAIIAAVALLGAGFLGYQNKGAYERQIDMHLAADKKLAVAEKGLADATTEFKKTEEELAEVKQMIVKLKADVSTVELATSELENKEAALNGELEVNAAEIEKVEKIIADVGPLEEIEREMTQLDQELSGLSSQVSSAKARVAGAEARRRSMQARIDQYLDLERDQRSGVMRRPLRATVETAYNHWGFVVLNSGDRQGVVPKVELAVLQGGYRICRLVVTTVEPNSSVASIVPGTLAPGYLVRSGDRVVVVPKETPAPAAKS